MTIKQLKRAVEDFFGDTSRTAYETKSALEDLRDDIEIRIESLEADLGE